MIRKISLLLTLVLMTVITVNAQAQKVKLVRADDKQKVDVIIGGKLFTSFQYPSNMEKPYLFPVYAPNGSVITRGFPLEARKGERVDHPHHIGIWFNHGNVNGLDFWNNSSAIPANRKDSYGHIVVKQIVSAKSGKKATLEVVSNWDDNKGNTLLVENTKYIFSADKDSRTIDHISTLTAANGTVTITDNKEGMFAIRVDRAFEMPSNESLIFTDDKGNPTTVKATDNTGVTGMYVSSSGLKGDQVWSSRNDWVLLSGTKDGVLTTMGVFDHPKNLGYPAHSHARGYGLFSTNNLGAQSYVKDHEKIVVTLQKGESITLRHRFYVTSGAELTAEKANQIFKEFSGLY
ncbi:MAG: PmoA family protein [Bacteroidales bacterium]|nr:PmoA family protein [Bacteroidales bacterium]